MNAINITSHNEVQRSNNKQEGGTKNNSNNKQEGGMTHTTTEYNEYDNKYNK